MEHDAQYMFKPRSGGKLLNMVEAMTPLLRRGEEVIVVTANPEHIIKLLKDKGVSVVAEPRYQNHPLSTVDEEGEVTVAIPPKRIRSGYVFYTARANPFDSSEYIAGPDPLLEKVKWSTPIPKSPLRKRGKLKCKIPMHKEVLTYDNEIWKYDFVDGELQWEYVCTMYKEDK